MAAKSTSFEEALEKLEETVHVMGDESLTLDESLKQFENGIKAIQQCRSALSKAEGKIVKLLKGSDGEYLEKLLNIDVESLTRGEEGSE